MESSPKGGRDGEATVWIHGRHLSGTGDRRADGRGGVDRNRRKDTCGKNHDQGYSEWRQGDAVHRQGISQDAIPMDLYMGGGQPAGRNHGAEVCSARYRRPGWAASQGEAVALKPEPLGYECTLPEWRYGKERANLRVRPFCCQGQTGKSI